MKWDHLPGSNQAGAGPHPPVRSDGHEIGRSVAALQEVYRRNVFPAMNVTWGTYPDNKGHLTSTGCFRCHDDSHEASDGSTISGDCEYCHKQVEPPSP